MRWLKRGSGSLLGLDIGTAAVKLVRWAPAACAVEPLPEGAVAGRNISDADAVGEAIARAVRRLGGRSSRNRRAAVAVAAGSAIIQSIVMEAALAADEAEVAAEAERHIPYPLDAVAWDFAPLGPVAGEPSRIRVLLAACRKEHVAQRVAAAERGGLRAVAVDIEPHAVQRAAARLAGNGNGAAQGVFDLGAAHVSLTVMAGGAALFAREEPLSGTDDAARNACMENLLAQYRAARPDAPCKRILLAGGAALAPHAAALAGLRLGQPTRIANPLAGTPAADAPAAAALLTACGLALRSTP